MKLPSKINCDHGKRQKIERKQNKLLGWYCLQRTEMKAAQACGGTRKSKQHGRVDCPCRGMKINAVVGKRDGRPGGEKNKR